MKKHSFSVGFAETVGVNAALILAEFEYIRDWRIAYGKTAVFQMRISALCDKFDYISQEDVVEACNKLQQQGFVKYYKGQRKGAYRVCLTKKFDGWVTGIELEEGYADDIAADELELSPCLSAEEEE